MSGRRDDRQDQDDVGVGGVDEAAADGVNDRQNRQKIEGGVDGRTTSAGEKLWGETRPEAEHRQSAESVENEDLKLLNKDEV